MKVITPLDLTGSRLTSTNVSEPSAGETAWSAASVSYSVGDARIRAATHRRYRCIVAHTSSASPTPENDPTNWVDDGPTNAYAMFDTLRNTATSRASPITVVITPGKRVDSVALLGLVAQTVTISVTSVYGGGTVYSSTISLQSRDTRSWSDYLFGEFRFKTAAVTFDLPMYGDAVITLTISHASSDVQCGAVVLGRAEHLGSAELSASSDTLNFSTVARDAAGAATVTQRRNVPVTKQRTFLDRDAIPAVRRIRDDLNAVPAVWSTLDDDDGSGYFEAFLVLGFYRRFLISAEHPLHCLVDLEIEEI